MVVLFMLLLFITDESSRVFLQPIRGLDGSDYINASFVDVSPTIITRRLFRETQQGDMLAP